MLYSAHMAEKEKETQKLKKDSRGLPIVERPKDDREDEEKTNPNIKKPIRVDRMG